MADVTMDALRMLTFIIVVLTYLIVAGKAQFTVQPESVERAEGLEVVFGCQYQKEEFTVTYDWFLNNSIVSEDTETVRARPPSSPSGPATLTILAIPQHNNTIIQCLAIIRNGINIVRSEISITATLTVHATIITDVMNATNTITVMWSALPLTEYCVGITKTTIDTTVSVVLDSVCEQANEYIFMYSNPIGVCDRFSFTVTPTDGERRGKTSEPDTGFFTRAEGSIEEPHRIRESGENKSVWFKATIPSCTRFTRYRVDSDLLTPSIDRSITDPLLFEGSLSFFLPTDKMTEYNVTLIDENRIDLVFENIPISTFDVQDLLVSECPGGGGICVSIKYVEGTVSPGALVCAVRIINEVLGVLDFANMKVVTIPRNSFQNFPIPVLRGEYRVIAFDLESNHLPNMPISMVALIQDNMIVNSGAKETTSPPPSSDGVSATKLSNGDAELTFSNSAQNCLVLFQPILDRVLRVVDFINTSESSTVIVQKETFGDGYVVVYSWNSSQSIFEGEVSLIMQLDPPTTNPPPPDMESLSTSVIAGIIVALVVIVLLIIIVAWCLMKKHKRIWLLQNGEEFHSSNSEGGFSVDVGASQVPFYDVACPGNMSLEVSTADTDDTPPLGYDAVRKENSKVGYAQVDKDKLQPVNPTIYLEEYS